eukprot:400282-Prorocentrum_minimum.AAC.1
MFPRSASKFHWCSPERLTPWGSVARRAAMSWRRQAGEAVASTFASACASRACVREHASSHSCRGRHGHLQVFL